jgi:crotonobetainyl-CoA:carnitine CoA-transferase CaiB-like acyl-CoA transferase
MGVPEMATDPRFDSMAARRENGRACVEQLEEIFATRDFDEWRHILTHDFEGEWVATQSPHDIADDPQVQANSYIAEVEMLNGRSLPMVTPPIQFDEQPGQPTRAPEHGEHTEAVLLDLGLTWDEIAALKAERAIL